jgi:minor extracellular serine protease Vpr
MKHRLSLVAITVTLTLSACGGGSGDETTATTSAQRTWVAPQAAPADAKVDPRLRAQPNAMHTVWVAMQQPSLARAQAVMLARSGTRRMQALNASQKSSMAQALATHRVGVLAQQKTVAQQLTQLGGRELARVQVAHNAIAVRILGRQLNAIAALPGVVRIRPVQNYAWVSAAPAAAVAGASTSAQALAHVGINEAHASGLDGKGVKVAVLDTGIDYTHRNLGGPGTEAAYTAAHGGGTLDVRNTERDGLFPTTKVIAGYDFLGESWGYDENGLEIGEIKPDDDPIDFDGHGTKVADILAGQSGAAPAAQLMAVKVCSAISRSCNGIASVQGMDFALDPNGDGDLSDGADVINLSLGTPYGQIEDDLTLAVSNAVELGAVVVSAAGNEADHPYAVNSPSMAPGAISVAQTRMPDAVAWPLQIQAPSEIAGEYGNVQAQDWAPVGAGFKGNVVWVGRGCPAQDGQAEDPYLASPAGKVALIERGSCSESAKVGRAARAGAIAVLIGQTSAGGPLAYGHNDGDSVVPTLSLPQSLSQLLQEPLKTDQTVSVSVSASKTIALVNNMEPGSSRGPSGLQQIKPEIGAPGALNGAVAGSGGRDEVLGGTSGASPVVAGAAALLLQAHPDFNPMQIKALLMNSAFTQVDTHSAQNPGERAPISRVGAGELRVNKAAKLGSLAWEPLSSAAALSFGMVDVPQPLTLRKTLRVENFSDSARIYRIASRFRSTEDADLGAVTLTTPTQLRVEANSSAELAVTLRIDPRRLQSWAINGGALGGDGPALNGPEFDGWLTLTSDADVLSLPWHVLPRKAAQTSTASVVNVQNGVAKVRLSNTGTELGTYDFFSLTGTSPAIADEDLPRPGDRFALIDLQSVGVRYMSAARFSVDLLQFAISTHQRRAHPNQPARFEIGIDTDNDGKDDFIAFNSENASAGERGQNVIFLQKADGSQTTPLYFADADLNSGNLIISLPMNAGAGTALHLGLAPGQTFTFSVKALDYTFTGATTDEINNMRFTPGQTRFESTSEPYASVPTEGVLEHAVQTQTVPDSASSEQGLLFLFRCNAGVESKAVTVN